MLTRELSSSFRRDYRMWNVIAGEVREVLETRVCCAIDATIDSLAEVKGIDAGAEVLRRSARWDAMHFVMEGVYAHLVPPRFYTAAFQIYAAGHVPCGWDTVWPNGQLDIY